MDANRRSSSTHAGCRRATDSIHPLGSTVGGGVLCGRHPRPASYGPTSLYSDIDRISAYMGTNRAATAQAISRALNLPIDLARKSLLTFVTLVGASAFRLTYCVHRLGIGYFLASSEEMMEADGDEILLYSIESTAGTDEVSVYTEETKAAKACFEQAQREGTQFACDHFGIRPIVMSRHREARMTKRRILIKLGKPPIRPDKADADQAGTDKPAVITELEEEEETDSVAPLRRPEPEPAAVPPPPCDIAEVSTLDDIMCRPVPAKRKGDAGTDKPSKKQYLGEMVDLTKGIPLPRFVGKAGKGGRQVTLSAWLK